LDLNNKLSNSSIGQISEDLACKYLIQQNYKIIERNWRFKKAEIDIIAKHSNCLIFIEVKSRSYTAFGQPEEAIDAKKEAMLIDAAQRFMESINYDWEIRFDIISMILTKSMKIKKIDHFKDAFF